MKKKPTILSLVFAFALLTTPATSFAQPGMAPRGEKTEAKDTTAKKAPKGPALISKFIKADAKVMEGMTTVIKQDKKFYLTIPDSLLGKDILVVSRTIKSAEGVRPSMTGYAGDIINENLIYFDKGPDNKVFIKTRSYSERSEGAMKVNLENSNFNPIMQTLDIVAYNEDKTVCLVDATSFLLSDSELIYFDKRVKKQHGLGGLQKDKSYIEDVTTYPRNTEIKMVGTFSRQSGAPMATYMLNASLVLLPEKPMTARYYDSRVGYFVESFTDFDKNPQKVERTSLITRWRLEPKPEDMEKYMKGELVEPVKPIVFYIDPATPSEWVPYLIAGVNDWQKAFEKAGFKNAIYAKVAPTKEEDPTWSLEDARYSAIVYKPSSVANASGPHVSDPRTGEILESHVNWYHNVMSLLKNWYFIQCSPVDPQARKMVFDTELMGQLIRFVSSHEIGHTLGLRHNFAGSSHYTAEQLRDTTFLRKYGHATSIMDYCRFDYVAQPGDDIPQDLLFPCIGLYDEWAIEWGYRLFPQFDDPKKEKAFINNWIIEKTSDPLFTFGTESDPSDPRLQSEDCGANQMETNELGVKNLKYIMNNLLEWTATPNEGYSNLSSMHVEINSQYKRYMNHVAKWVGGVYTDNKTVEMDGPVRTFVPASKQKEALAFLQRNMFEPQLWLIPENVLSLTKASASKIIGNNYTAVMGNLVNKRVLTNMFADEIANGASAYSISEYFDDLEKMIWKTSSDPRKAIFNRELQKAYVNALVSATKAPDGGVSGMLAMMAGGSSSADLGDVNSMLFYMVQKTQKMCESMSKKGDAVSRAHFAFLANKLAEAQTKAPAASANGPRNLTDDCCGHDHDDEPAFLNDYYRETSKCWVIE